MAVRARTKIAGTLTKRDDAELIQLARKRFDQCVAAESQQRQRELEDLEFYAGKQWPQDVLNARQGQPGNASSGLPPVPARPSMTINLVKEPILYVVNKQRSQQLGVEVAADDDFGDGSSPVSKAEIELREGLIRRIQRQSKANDARMWAFNRGVIAGRGFWRVMIRYAPGRTMDQDIFIDRIYNQASVSLDPAHELPDGSDAEWGFIGSDVPFETYKRQFRKVVGANGSDYRNPVSSLNRQDFRNLGDELPGWFTTSGETRSVRVVEYWRVVYQTETIHELTTGHVVSEDDLTDEDEIGEDSTGKPLTRTREKRSIEFVKMDGVQVLERVEWPGQFLPIIKYVGEEIQPFDSERRCVGMVRDARDSNRGANVMISGITEDIALSPKSPWIIPVGVDEGFEDEYQLSATRNIPALHFNVFNAQGQPIAGAVDPTPKLPQGINPADVAAQVQALGFFQQGVKSTMAVPDPALGDIPASVKSATGIKAVLDQSAVASSHYGANFERSLNYEGQVVNDLLYPVFTRKGRQARLMKPDGTTHAVPLHVDVIRHPQTQAVMPLSQVPPEMATTAPQPFQFTLTPDATWQVAIKVTENEDTRRQQQENTLTTLIQEDPNLMSVFGDLLFKYNDGPGHEELEERAVFLLNPAIQAKLQQQQGKAPQSDPQQQIQQLQAKIQELQPLADKNQVSMQVAQIKAQSDQQIADINAQAKVVVAEIAAKSEQILGDVKAQIQVLSTLIGTVHEERLAEKEHAHDALKTLHAATHDVGLAAVDHATTIAEAAQGHQQTLEQGQQAAALAPPEASNGETDTQGA